MDILGKGAESKTSKNEQLTFYCEKCDYTCSKKYNWDRHLSASKHKILLNPTKSYLCECGKQYKHSTTLYAHKKTCKFNNASEIMYKCEKEDNEPTDKVMMMMLIKQNSDLIKEQSDIKQIILELVKNGTNNSNTTNNTIHNNSHNKAFNLNFFLNETCKNAMNITEFVDSIQWELEDLMELGEIGYVAGMSKIITKNLNALDETVRPIHCADKKREIFYIKDEDKWEKEDEEMKRLRKIILRISNKSMKLLPKYREKFPDYDDAKSIRSDELCKIIIEAVTCDSVKDEKIIRNISKATMISKEASLSSLV
jgi:hypothetical protein